MGSRYNKFTSVRYHDVFNFKLTKTEIIKWKYKKNNEEVSGIKNKNRIKNEYYSRKKIIIAKNVSKLLSKIPTVKFVGITGSLAMMNASKDGDIDLMIITTAGKLWVTRLISYLFIYLFGFNIRKPNDNFEKDRLCLNLWLDDSDLIWDKIDRNLYTAHEIAQIVPLVNKDNIYEKFLYLNRWILNFWPNAVAVQSTQYIVHRQQKLSTKYYVLGTIFEKLAYNIQYWYMRNKITREIITPTRAIFHPNNWGKTIIDKLST